MEKRAPLSKFTAIHLPPHSIWPRAQSARVAPTNDDDPQRERERESASATMRLTLCDYASPTDLQQHQQQKKR